MSSVIQTQGVYMVAATLPDATTTTINMPRPQTSPTPPGYAEGSDHVTLPVFLREEESGHCVIDLPTAFVAANVYLRRASIYKLMPTPQKNVAGPSDAYWPTGAPTNAEFVRDLVNTGTANTLATNADAVRDLFGNLRTGAAVRSFPGITLEQGQYVRLELYNASGGPLGPATINVVYKLGLNQKDTGKP
jgi:hypothetical protein